MSGLYITMKTSRVINFVIVLLFLACSCSKKAPVDQQSQFSLRQVWSFHYPNSTNTTFTVVFIDRDPEVGPVVYVSLSGVPRSHYEKHLFMPFCEQALRQSAVTLIAENADIPASHLSDFGEAYQDHQNGIRSRNLSKCFDKTIAEVMDAKRKTTPVAR